MVFLGKGHGALRYRVRDRVAFPMPIVSPRLNRLQQSQWNKYLLGVGLTGRYGAVQQDWSVAPASLSGFPLFNFSAGRQRSIATNYNHVQYQQV